MDNTEVFSPRPWKYLRDEGQFIVDARGDIAAEISCHGPNPDNGDLIVRAVNAHEALYSALVGARTYVQGALSRQPRKQLQAKGMLRHIDAALDLARSLTVQANDGTQGVTDPRQASEKE